MRHSIFGIFGLFLGLSLTACSTPKVLTESDRKIETGLVLPYLLSAKEPAVVAQGCELVVKKEGTNELFSLSLKTTGKYSFVSIPLGRFFISKLSCPYQRSWGFDDGAFPPMTAFQGKVSLAGPLKINVPEEPGILSFGRLIGDEAFGLVQASYLGVPISIRSKLVSSITGISILSPMVQRAKKTATWVVSPLERNDRNMRDSTSPDFQTCLKDEGLVIWLWLGEIKASAIYDEKRLQKIEFDKSPHTFTMQFIQCITKKLEEFKTPYPGKVRYDLTL